MKGLLIDAVALVGLTLLTAGAYLAYPPAGLIVPGAALLAGAVLAALRSRPEESPDDPASDTREA